MRFAWLAVAVAGVAAGGVGFVACGEDGAARGDVDADVDIGADANADVSADVEVHADADVRSDVGVDSDAAADTTDAAVDAVPDGADADLPDALDDADGDVDDAGDDGDSDSVADDGDDGVPDTSPADTSAPSCVEGDPCQPLTYVPPCYEGRCNARGACMLAKIDRCCLKDGDCAPNAEATACEESRCVAARCTLVTFPGCCADDPARCGSGLLSGTSCDEASGRCHACPAAACPQVATLFEARFEDGVWPLSISDFQIFDQVTWQVDDRRHASGGGAAYLGNARCRTYYGGALDGACVPTADGEQDSGRVQVQARTPWVMLPADQPSVATLWVWADVEPTLGRGAAEPDVLRISVEPGDGGPAWPVASTLDIGKTTGGAWKPLAVDLVAWQGQYVRLLLDFDTFDGENNRYEGLWIDDFVIAPTCRDGGCCAADLDCPDADACNLGRCVPAAQGTGGVCLAGPREPNASCATCDAAMPGACDDHDPCTADACVAGACEHDAFCCVEHDVLDVDVGRDGLQTVYVQDDDPSDGVDFQADEGAAWFGDATSGTYASRAPPRRVGGGIWTLFVTLPDTSAPLALDVDLSLSTEWDLADSATFTNPAGLDRVSITIVDGQFTTEVWSSDAIDGSTHGAVVPVRVDLGPWRGRTVSVRVRFDSGDADANGFDGLRVYRMRAGSRCD